MADAADGFFDLFTMLLRQLLQHDVLDRIEKGHACCRLLAQEVLLDRQQMVSVQFRALVLVQCLDGSRIQLGRLMRYRVVSHDGVTAEDLLLGHLINDGRDELVFKHGLHLRHLLETLVLVQIKLVLLKARSRVKRILATRQHTRIGLALG